MVKPEPVNIVKQVEKIMESEPIHEDSDKQIDMANFMSADKISPVFKKVEEDAKIRQISDYWKL
jgi:alpha-acetolactate decarboxylase